MQNIEEQRLEIPRDTIIPSPSCTPKGITTAIIHSDFFRAQNGKIERPFPNPTFCANTTNSNAYPLFLWQSSILMLCSYIWSNSILILCSYGQTAYWLYVHMVKWHTDSLFIWLNSILIHCSYGKNSLLIPCSLRHEAHFYILI